MPIVKNKVLTFEYLQKLNHRNYTKVQKTDYAILAKINTNLIYTRKAINSCCLNIELAKRREDIASTVVTIKCVEYKYKHKQLNLVLECTCGHKFKFRMLLDRLLYDPIIKLAIKEKIEI